MATVGFIGLGTMGAGMVRNLMDASFVVRGFNRTPARADALVAQGMIPCASPAEAASGSEFVVACVSDDDALRGVAWGESGFLARTGSGSLVLDCGTTGLELTASLRDAVAKREAAFIDAPITGSKLGAAGGRLTFMVGGPNAAVERAVPLFEAMGRHHVHVAEQVGAGQAAKYCLNMSQAVVLEGILEGYALGRKLGVPVEKLSEIFEHSAGKTGVGSFKTPYLLKGDYEPHFRLDLMHKDLHLALAEAQSHRIPLPAAQAVRTLYDQGVAEGLGERDFLVLAELLARWARIEWHSQ